MEESFLALCCEICYSEYDDKDFAPVLFNMCGHSCCKSCVELQSSQSYLSANTFKLKCFKCRVDSEFKFIRDRNQQVNLVDFENKVLIDCQKRFKNEACNHSNLVKPKYTCFNPQCYAFSDKFCGFCMKTKHKNCPSEVLFKHKEFASKVTLDTPKTNLGDWNDKLNLEIDNQTKKLADSLKASVLKFRSSLESQFNTSDSLDYEKYTKDRHNWIVSVDNQSNSASLKKKQPFEYKPILVEVSKLFELDIWMNLHLIINPLFEDKISKIVSKVKSNVPDVKLNFENDYSDLFKDLAIRDKGNLKKYKEIIEGHVIIMQKEINLKTYYNQINEQTEQAKSNTTKLKSKLESLKSNAHNLKKKAAYKLKMSNKKLSNLLAPMNKLFFKKSQLDNLIETDLKLKNDEKLMKKTQFYYLSKTKIEKVKKLMNFENTAIKQQFFKNIIQSDEFLVTKIKKKQLKNLNSPTNKFEFAKYQKFENEFFASKISQKDFQDFIKTLKDEKIVAVFCEIEAFLADSMFYEFSFEEFKIYFKGIIFDEGKLIAKSNLEFRVKKTLLNKFFADSIDEFNDLEELRKEYQIAKAVVEEYSIKINQLSEIVEKGIKMGGIYERVFA